MSIIKIGLVGYGYWGPNLIRNFKKHKFIKPTYVCDLNQNNLNKVLSDHDDMSITTDINIILNNDDIDAVAIATPVSTHYSLIKKSLLSGKHVWIEKPMTNCYESALELVNIAKEKNLILMCDHTYCYHPAVTKIKNLIDDELFSGDLLYIDSTRINLGIIQHDINVIWDLIPHDLSIINYILQNTNKKISKVSASAFDLLNTGHESIANITLYFDDNCISYINLNWLSPVKVRKMMIGMTKKMIIWDDINPDEKIKIYDKGISVYNDTTEAFISYRNGDINIPKIDNQEPLFCAVDDFYNSIINKKNLLPTMFFLLKL